MADRVLLVRVPTFWNHVEAMGALANSALEVVQLPMTLDDPHDQREDVVAIIIGDPDFPEAYLDRYPRLRVIARTGTGYDRIPVQAARERGITLTRVTTFSAEAVSEFAIGLLLALTRNIVASHNRLLDNRWQMVKGPALGELAIGIVGLGSIGQALAAKLRALGAKRLLGWNRTPRDSIQAIALHCQMELLMLDEVLAQSDVVILCVAATSTTRHLISRERLGLMQSHAQFINVARGEVVDEDALVDALQRKQLGGAAIDVFSQEPPFRLPAFQALVAMAAQGNVVLTSHQGGQTTHYGQAAPPKIAHDVLAALRGEYADIEHIP